MRFAGCFAEGLGKALTNFERADTIELRLEIDQTNRKYEVIVVEALFPDGKTVVRRVKEKRDGR